MTETEGKENPRTGLKTGHYKSEEQTGMTASRIGDGGGPISRTDLGTPFS
jgi:hypothetical protein